MSILSLVKPFNGAIVFAIFFNLGWGGGVSFAHAEDDIFEFPSNAVLEKIIGEDPRIAPSCLNESYLRTKKDWSDLASELELWLKPEKLTKSIILKVQSIAKDGSRVGASSEKKWAKYKKVHVGIRGTSCKIKGKYRLTGDLEDHFGALGDISHSLKIKLKDDSIGGITKFKLFAPKSRYGDYEVLNTLLLRRLGFIAPRTSMVSVKIGGQTMTAIFQEDITKELIEENNIHDGILIEGDERDAFTYFANPKVVNEKVLKSVVGLKIASDILVPISAAYLKTYMLSHHMQRDMPEVPPFFDPAVSSDFFPTTSVEEIEKFNLINFAMNSIAGLSLHDHRFIYDHISRKFLPIYYDGHSLAGESPLASYDVNFEFGEKSKEYLVTEMRNIDRPSFVNRAKKLGVQKGKEEILSFLDGVIFNLERLKVSEDYLSKKSQLSNIAKDDFIRKYSQNIIRGELHPFTLKAADLKFYWLSTDNLMKECIVQDDKMKCMERSLSSNEVNDLPIGRSVSISNGQYLFGFNSSRPSYFDLISHKFPVLKDTMIEASPGIKPIVNPKNKTINFEKNGASGAVNQIRIFGGKLQDWTIVVGSDLALGYEKLQSDRRSMNGYTGCLTLNDMEIENISIIIEQTQCEDSIHFVRVNGSVESIIVGKAYADAIDADFSNIEFRNISIKGAGNDCIDISAGSYLVENIKLDGCTDKAISAGEEAKLNANNVLIGESLIGVVAKDGAKVEIENLSVSSTNVCTMAYRKKVEFTHGEIRVKTSKCNGAPSFVQKGSMIAIN